MQTETENDREKQGTDRNEELRTETECREKQRNKDRSGDARNGSEGWEC